MPTIVGVDTSTTAFVGRARSGPVGSPTLVSSFAGFANAFGALWTDSPMSFAVQQFFANGGTNALIVRASAADPGMPLTSGDILGSAVDKTGIYALQDSVRFNLLCLPPPAPGVDIDQTTWTEAAKFCQQQRALLLVDAPDVTPSVVRTSGPALISDESTRKNAALFYPRLTVSGPSGSATTPTTFAPCGAVAGIFARIDSTRGEWKAPAGIEGGVIGARPSRSLTDPDNAKLNSIGVNCIRSFPTIGTVLWGARTMDGADATASVWKYIPVRRTALFIEESVEKGLQWTVFEPNAAPLWAQVTLDVSSFLHGLFKAGAFKGSTPKDAYFVRCDLGTMTQIDIENGRINVMIGFAPLKPAEFVILRISINQVS